MQPQDLDKAFEALKTYDWGTDRKTMNPIDDAVVATYGDAAARKALEKRLAAVLGSGASRSAKDYVCRTLKTIGTAESVPALAALLPDKDLSHMARYALERIPAPEAAAAMRDALPGLSGALKAGVDRLAGRPPRRGQRFGPSELAGRDEQGGCLRRGLRPGIDRHPRGRQGPGAGRQECAGGRQTGRRRRLPGLRRAIAGRRQEGGSDCPVQVSGRRRPAEARPPGGDPRSALGRRQVRISVGEPCGKNRTRHAPRDVRPHAEREEYVSLGGHAGLDRAGRISVVKSIAILCRSALSLTLLLGLGGGLRAAEAPGGNLVEMIVNLVGDKDRDMRALGLQQVRDEAKGPAATKQFVALLPKLPPESQAGLLDALGGRGDRAARPAVLPMLKSEDAAVQAAAIRALGPLGEAADVPLLTPWLTVGSAKAAARESLARLSGPDVNTVIVTELKRAKPEARAELLGVLAARKARETLPVVLQSAGDDDAGVRLAALTALRWLAGEDQAPVLVKLLVAAKGDQEQWQAEQALLAVCGHAREACVEAILAGMADAGPSARAALLRALSRLRGGKALAAIVAATKDPQPEVSSEALRLLAWWPDASAIPPLLAIARQTESVRQNIVAVQALIRVASPLKDKPADADLLGEAMKLARRPQEKRLALGVLQNMATPAVLSQVTAAIDDPALGDSACLAAVMAAEKLTGLDAGQRRAALEKVVAKAKDPQLRHRAEKALESLGRP